MKRTKLSQREFCDYTRKEELIHSTTHATGILFGVLALITCLAVSSCNQNIRGIAGSMIYGTALIVLYAMSTLYHSLPRNTAKKVLQVLDHCTIYFLIAGTYTPIVLCKICPHSPAVGWAVLAFVWSCAMLGAVLTAIDLKKYAKFSMVCYIGMGWCIVLAIRPAMEALSLPCLLWILAGGIAYTVGAVLYGLGKKRQYMHAVFHVFVLLGSFLQYVAIIRYVL